MKLHVSSKHTLRKGAGTREGMLGLEIRIALRVKTIRLSIGAN